VGKWPLVRLAGVREKFFELDGDKRQACGAVRLLDYSVDDLFELDFARSKPVPQLLRLGEAIGFAAVLL